MRKIPALIFILLFATGAFASDEETIANQMKDYWAAFSNANFNRAAEYIYPADLAAAKKELLPVFLAAGESANPELNSVADSFFLNVPRESRSSISGAQVFIGLNNFIGAANPQLFVALRDSTIEILETALGTADSATITYRILINGTPATDLERFSRLNGKWYVRVKEDPRDTAGKFRQAFGL